MYGVCGDNRFEIINKVKKRLLETTNIEQSPKELEVLDNLLFRLWQCGYFDYIETFEKNKMTFKEWYKKSDCELTGVTIGIARCIFQAGAKEMLKENEQLKQQIERMKCCGNCFHHNKPSDKEFCWNCERQLDERPIIKDEWEIEE